MAFATSAVRESVNGEEVLAGIKADTQVDIEVLSGQDEARLTFLAVRRWFGWSSGTTAGAGHRRRVAGDRLGYGRAARCGGVAAAGSRPPHPRPLHRRPAAGRRGAGAAQARTDRDRPRGGKGVTVRPGPTTRWRRPRRSGSSRGSPARRRRTRGRTYAGCSGTTDLVGWTDRLAGMSTRERAELPGVSEGRAPQLLAGAIVADATMDLFGVARLEVCPWALREGSHPAEAGRHARGVRFIRLSAG